MIFDFKIAIPQPQYIPTYFISPPHPKLLTSVPRLPIHNPTLILGAARDWLLKRSTVRGISGVEGRFVAGDVDGAGSVQSEVPDLQTQLEGETGEWGEAG